MVIIIFCLTVMQPILLPETTTIIAHLKNQQVSHEIIDLELIVLLEKHSDNSVNAVCA